MEEKERIKYGCECGRYFPIQDLYYCQHCQKISCSFCVTQEIESYFCPNCLELMASSEAMVYKNRCKKCFNCPLCSVPLSIQPGSEKGEKIYYFACGFCRWWSLQLSLKGDSPATLIAKTLDLEKEGSGQEQLTKLIETLQKEEREKAKEKKQNKIKKTSLKKILPTSIAIQTNEQAKPKRERIPSSVKVTDLDSILEEKEMKRRSVPQTQILPPNDDIEFAPFFYGLDINTISSLPQRLCQLQNQPRNVTQLLPPRQKLLTQKSKHCRKCDRLICKPDLSSSKIGFQRQHIALLFAPRISLVKVPHIPFNIKFKIPIKISNPLLQLMNISISWNHEAPDTTAELFIPPLLSTFLPPRDHTEEDEDEMYKQLRAKDDHEFVVGRKQNIVIIHLVVLTKKTEVKFTLIVGVNFSSSGVENNFAFPVFFDLGLITQWIK